MKKLSSVLLIALLISYFYLDMIGFIKADGFFGIINYIFSDNLKHNIFWIALFLIPSVVLSKEK